MAVNWKNYIKFIFIVVAFHTYPAEAKSDRFHRTSFQGEGEYVEGPYLYEFPANETVSCAAECMLNPMCQSLNYVTVDKKCELSDKRTEPCLSKLKRKKGVEHYSSYVPDDDKPQCCAEYKYLNHLDTMPNGNYTLYPGTPKTIPVQMYCFADSKIANGFKEFVNLTYPNRNRSPTARQGDKTGGTQFTKVRIDIRTLKVYESDYEFSTKYGGGQYDIPYGQGKGCTKSAQGFFEIDLRKTKFQIRKGTSWTKNPYGNPIFQRQIQTAQQVKYKCDGDCGHCYVAKGLYFQLYDP